MSAGLKANSDGVTGSIQLNGTDVAQITSAGIIAPNIHAANIKSTPVGNDEFGVWDYATGLLNRLSWTNLLASIVIDPVWVIKSTTYQAVAHDAIMANTTAGVFTITLPINPPVKTLVRIADYAGTFASNNLTVARNGQNIMGLAQDLILNLNNASITLTYIDATQGWRMV